MLSKSYVPNFSLFVFDWDYVDEFHFVADVVFLGREVDCCGELVDVCIEDMFLEKVLELAMRFASHV